MTDPDNGVKIKRIDSDLTTVNFIKSYCCRFPTLNKLRYETVAKECFTTAANSLEYRDKITYIKRRTNRYPI